MTEIECSGCKCSFLTFTKRYNYLSKHGHTFYCNKKCFLKYKRSVAIEKICLFCKNSFESTTRSDSRKCCSLLCSHKYAQTFTDPRNVSIAAKEAWKTRNHTYLEKTCPVCKRSFLKK